MDAAVSQLGNGLVLGAVIAITAVGLSLIYGVTRVVNFAHGDLVTLGAVVALGISQPSRIIPGGRELEGILGFGWPIGGTIVLTIVIGAAVGAFLELALFRPLRYRKVGGVTLLIVTIGLSFIIRYLILIWIGGDTYTYRLGPDPQQTYLGFIDMSGREMRVLVLSVVVLVVVGLFLSYTRLGTAMRAISDNEDLAESSGVNADRVFAATWAIGISLAFLGGIFLALTQDVRWTSGFALLLLMFAAIILGGIGNPFGAMIGGFIIGVLTSVSQALPLLQGRRDLRIVIALAVMILILLYRPQGILGTSERVS